MTSGPATILSTGATLSESLLQQVAAGDRAAMQKCIDRYGGLVWSLARRWSRDVNEAEDAVQEVFISLWQAADRYDPTASAEPTFITMVARRRLIDRRRRASRRREVEWVEEEIDEPASEEKDLSISSDTQVAEQAMSRLRSEQQQVLRLAIHQGLTHREIAARTGTPLGTVKKHARRGLQRLREVLKAKRSEGGGTGS